MRAKLLLGRPLFLFFFLLFRLSILRWRQDYVGAGVHL